MSISRVSGTVLSILHTFIHLISSTILWGWCIIFPILQREKLRPRVVEQHARLYSWLVAELGLKLSWSHTTACALNHEALLPGSGSLRFTKPMAFMALTAVANDHRIPGARGALTMQNTPCWGFSLNCSNSLMRPGLLFGSSRWGNPDTVKARIPSKVTQRMGGGVEIWNSAETKLNLYPGYYK